MERREYLEMCQHCSVLAGEMFGVKKNVPDDLRVVYKEAEYYPFSYQLGFDRKGQVIHTAILHELKSNAIVCAPLNDIKRKVEEK